ncbi:MAG: hypothetical protein BWY74_04446 [Firmicutes bacterium ADurb.Bin419]|nr:MAG: hypothetical protein BWY74_04446 [Firmicutes bacterium ADurb.Bin419]
MSPGGDYDLTVIFNEPVSDNVTGIHFSIAGIPIDCMLLSINDFLGETPEDPFLLVHLNCTILYDRDNTTRNLLEGIKQRWSMPAVLSDCEVNTFRFTFKHILDKLKHRLFHDELYSRYFIFSSMDWFLQCYARIYNLEIGKPKVHLSYIKSNDPELYGMINRMYHTMGLSVQFDLLRECAERMLIKITECPKVGLNWQIPQYRQFTAVPVHANSL